MWRADGRIKFFRWSVGRVFTLPHLHVDAPRLAVPEKDEMVLCGDYSDRYVRSRQLRDHCANAVAALAAVVKEGA